MTLVLHAALLAVLAVPEEDDFEPEWDAVEDAPDLEHRLRGHVLPSLLDLEDVTLALQFHGLDGAGENATPATLHSFGEVANPLDAEIRGLSFAIALVPANEIDRMYARRTDPPLSLTEADLEAPFPQPVAVAGEGEAAIEFLENGAHASFDIENDLGEIPLDESRLPAYLLVVDRYTLELPTANDVVTILQKGGTADLAALAEWAAAFQDERVAFTDEERARVMEAVLAGFRRMRSPPALGDVQRLMALDRLIQVIAGPNDLEPILKLERPIKILHAAAVLAYDANLRDEAMLGVPIHAMDRLPSRSDFLIAPDLALSALRPAVLDRLLTLAFDPLDFRDAPRSTFPTSRLRREANQLLAPIQTTDVHAVLEAAADAEVQGEALRFYVKARHAPVVDPLVAWLIAHPEAFDDVGRLALREIPGAMLPAVMRAYVDPAEPENRALLRDYLEAMPVELAPQLLESFRALGLDTSEFVQEGVVDVVGVLDEFESQEARLDRHRATELVEKIVDNGVEPSTLRTSVSAITRLAQLDEEAIEANAELLIAVLSEAAWEFDQDNPTESTKALGLLEQLRFGRHTAAARTAAVMTKARLAERAGEAFEALAALVEHDPELADPNVRALWTEMMSRQFEAHLSAGKYDLATRLIDQAEALRVEEIDATELRRQLKWRRYRAAVVVGAIFALVLFGSVVGLVLRAAMTGLARWRKERQEMARLVRRQQDAEASSRPAGFEEGADPDLATKMIEVPPPSNRDVVEPALPSTRKGLFDAEEPVQPATREEVVDAEVIDAREAFAERRASEVEDPPAAEPVIEAEVVAEAEGEPATSRDAGEPDERGLDDEVFGEEHDGFTDRFDEHALEHDPFADSEGEADDAGEAINDAGKLVS